MADDSPSCIEKVLGPKDLAMIHPSRVGCVGGIFDVVDEKTAILTSVWDVGGSNGPRNKEDGDVQS